MELKNIEAFLEVVEKKSFSAAANSLFITQPSISTRIQLLERELDTSLFLGTRGAKVELTKEGEKVYPYFKEAVELIRKGRNQLFKSDIKPLNITMACPSHIGVYVVPELYKILFTEFREIDFSTKISKTEEIIENIRNGKVNIGFTHVDNIKIYKDLLFVEVTNERNILVCSPDHPLAKKEDLSPKHLNGQRIIINNDYDNINLLEDYLHREGIVSYEKVDAHNMGWLKMMVRNGLGVSFLQKISIRDELETGKIIELPFHLSIPSIPIYLIFKRSFPEYIRLIISKAAKSLF